MDIVNVHAAAVNLSQANDRIYRSQEDTFHDNTDDEDKQMCLMEAYGLTREVPSRHERHPWANGSENDDYYGDLRGVSQD